MVTTIYLYPVSKRIVYIYRSGSRVEIKLEDVIFQELATAIRKSTLMRCVRSWRGQVEVFNRKETEV